MNGDVRKQLNEFIAQNGVLAKHVANRIGISNSMISCYRWGKKNLGEENEQKLATYLSERGVNV